MSKWIDISGISIPSDENDYYELVAFADAIAELEPIYMESVQAEAYNRGIDSERKRIADAWRKAEYERGYKDGRKSADRPQGEWKDRTYGGRILHPWWESCECSQCEEWGSGAWNFCPNCGARMKGADDECD